jgi:hypothetical protein
MISFVAAIIAIFIIFNFKKYSATIWITIISTIIVKAKLEPKPTPAHLFIAKHSLLILSSTRITSLHGSFYG